MSKAYKGLLIGSKNHLYGKLSMCRKKIKCMETKEIFDSITSAANNKSIHRQSISNCLNGWSNSAGGYSWEVV